MRSGETLATIAELAVALAGFSGIAVALGSRTRGEWSAQDRYGFGALLRSSLGAALFALVPLVLSSAALDEPVIWTLSSAANSAYLGVALLFALPQARAARTVPDAFWFLGAVFGLQFALLLGNAVWVHAAWPHLAAQVVALGVAALAFARLLTGPR